MTIQQVDIGVSGISYDGILGGSVQVNGSGDITRQLHLQAIGHLGTIQPNTVLTVTYNAVTVFVGPVTRVTRSGQIYDIEANDYAHWGLAPYRIMEPFTLAESTSVGAACNTLASYMGLSTSATWARTLGTPMSVERGAEPWRIIKDLVAGAGGVVYFSAAGNLVIQRRPQTGGAVDWAISATTELLTEPRVTWDTANYRSAVEVIGNLPCDETVRGFAGGAASGRYAVELIETEDVTDLADAQAMAEEILEDFGVADSNADFDTIPNPSMEVYWKVSVPDVGEFLVDTFTIPLTVGSMSVGANKRVVLATDGVGGR